MYPEVELILAEVLALDPRYLPLCRDCRGYAIVNGRAEGVLFAGMLRKAAIRYREAEACRRAKARGLALLSQDTSSGSDPPPSPV
jgi:hypothetical protein